MSVIASVAKQTARLMERSLNTSAHKPKDCFVALAMTKSAIQNQKSQINPCH
jgi:hypothetical protein